MDTSESVRLGTVPIFSSKTEPATTVPATRTRERKVHKDIPYPQGKIIVNPKNKETFSAPPVGEVSNLAGVERPINSKLYYKIGNRTYLLIKNGARNNGAGDSNTKNLKVHMGVSYPQGKIKICEKTWI